MIKIESKVRSLNGSQVKVFDYVSDFRNFDHLLPKERLRNIELNKESCSFTLEGLGTIKLKITEKTPFHHLKICSDPADSMDFILVFQFNKAEETVTNVKASLQANLTMFLEMMARNPLQQMIDIMVDKLSEIDFTR